jgi:hypothetical protein
LFFDNSGASNRSRAIKKCPGAELHARSRRFALTRAIRYLAMAFKAREDGEADFARRLAERATELSEEASTLSNRSTPELEVSLELGDRACTRHSVK